MVFNVSFLECVGFSGIFIRLLHKTSSQECFIGMLYLRCIVLSKSGLGLILLRQVNCEAIVEARSGACGTDCWNYAASRLRAEQGCWMHKNEGRGRQTATVYGRAGGIFASVWEGQGWRLSATERLEGRNGARRWFCWVLEVFGF